MESPQKHSSSFVLFLLLLLLLFLLLLLLVPSLSLLPLTLFARGVEPLMVVLPSTATTTTPPNPPPRGNVAAHELEEQRGRKERKSFFLPSFLHPPTTPLDSKLLTQTEVLERSWKDVAGL